MSYIRYQHGRPMQILDMGETAIDQETFEEYLAEISDLYTADKASGQSHFHSMLP